MVVCVARYEGYLFRPIALVSALNTLVHANIETQELKLTIVAPIAPPQIRLNTAILLPHQFQIKHGLPLEVQTAYSSLMYALIVAESFIRSDYAFEQTTLKRRG